ncbi:N-acetylmuramoyl-L-alanine amidase [Erwinia sp. JH02]|nr:N-acetylmuramoyl-L-alanine amidase [Erwinia sp. JH02]
MAELEKSWRNSDKVHQIEKVKNYPDRFPSNVDSIGIEIVGESEKTGPKKKLIYEPVNDRQNDSLKWLIKELTTTLNIPMHEIYRHPEIGRKNATEASTAKW